MHFFIFLILYRWSGLKWQWAIILIFSIEVWETADWALDDPMRWWVRLDTWADICAGGVGMLAAVWLRHITSQRQSN